MNNDQSKALGEFIFQSKYSRYNPVLKRKETFEESVDRIQQMHVDHLLDKYPNALGNSEFNSDFIEAFQLYKEGKIYGSQRALQFGGDPILKHNEKMYNCSFLYVDKIQRFKEVEWLLINGCGVGVSLEFRHVNKLPEFISSLNTSTEEITIEDTSEGWAMTIDRLIRYYFENIPYPKFNYSKIRPKGALISTGFLAPGPEPLKAAVEKIRELMDYLYKNNKDRRLSPINCADILSHCADSIIAGGVRRSALSILFSPTDQEMFKSKTGNWFYDNPQRGRYNASVALERSDDTWDIFNKAFEYTKEYGEPGFFFRSDKGVGCNP